MLQTSEFLDNGWAEAKTTTEAELPDSPVLPCLTITTDTAGVEYGYAAHYHSSHSYAREIVARYSSESTAKRAYSHLLDEVTNCESSSTTPEPLKITSFAHTVPADGADGVDDIRWWNTQDRSEQHIDGVLGVVRSDDRIAAVYLYSADSQIDGSTKGGTTRIDPLLATAGRRLV